MIHAPFRPIVLVICLAVLVTANCSGADPSLVRVLSYNIHHGEGVDGRLDLERIARVLLSVEPDLVALQEVDRRVSRTQSVDQPSELARLTAMHVVFGANIPLQGGHYGNAILSRYPFVRHENHLLPNFDGSEQRGVLLAEIEVNRTPVLFLATHLDFRSDPRERLASTKAINLLATKNVNAPAILAGDLNDTPGSGTLRELETQWAGVRDEPFFTIPVGKPTKQIDFILQRPGDRWQVMETRVLDEAIASDHRAILSVLKLLPSP